MRKKICVCSVISCSVLLLDSCTKDNDDVLKVADQKDACAFDAQIVTECKDIKSGKTYMRWIWINKRMIVL